MRIEEAQFTHLTVDMLGARYTQDQELVEFFLKHLAQSIGMQPIDRPHVYGFPKREGQTDSGVTGFQVIQESHISVHTFPEGDNLVSVDVFSCRAFDREQAIKVIGDFWKPNWMHINSIQRQDVIEELQGRRDHRRKLAIESSA